MPPRIPLAPGYFFCSWQSRQEPWSLPHRFPPGRSRVLLNPLTVLPTAPLAINLVDRPHASAANVTLKLPTDWERTKACTPPTTSLPDQARNAPDVTPSTMARTFP